MCLKRKELLDVGGRPLSQDLSSPIFGVSLLHLFPSDYPAVVVCHLYPFQILGGILKHLSVVARGGNLNVGVVAHCFPFVDSSNLA